MELLHKEQKSLAGRKFDFIFIHDDDLKTLIQGHYSEYAAKYKEKGHGIIFIGYPSFNSVVPEGVDFPVSLIKDMYPCTVR